MYITKKVTVSLLAIVLAFTATSCSNSETEMETPKQALLKKAILKRNASGEYSIEYVVADQTVSDQIRVDENSSNEFHLSKVNYETKQNYTENVALDNNKLHLGFIDYEANTRMNLSIEDENIKFAKGKTQADNFLKSYSLMKINGDDAVQLSFEVQDNVSTEFTFNEETGTYEVHLKTHAGSNQQTSFDRSLAISATGDVFKLDFVNYTTQLASKGFTAGEVDPYYAKSKRKPRLIWQFQ